MSRQYFGTDGIRGKVGTFPITPDFVLKLGWALGDVLSRNISNPKVLIGKDTRISGYMFESALEAGLSAAGVQSYMTGPLPTPGIAFLIQDLHLDAGIVISASHNPYQDNGFKILSAEGQKFCDEWELLIEEAIGLPMITVASEKLGKATRVNDATTRYIEHCKNTFSKDLSLKGLRIVLDTANGATYHVAPQVFQELGAEVSTIGSSPNGLNINEKCGSLHTEKLKRAVLEKRADVGIAFDGDGDRVIMVDHQCNVVDGDEILYVIARLLQQRHMLRGGVVGTSASNCGLEIALKECGIPFVRSKVGDRYVLEELLKRGWNLGGESSGHIICRDVATTGDGIVAALQVLSAMIVEQKSLFDLRANIQKWPQVWAQVPVAKRISLDQYPEIQSAISSAQKKLEERGRIIVRPSGTEPLIRIMVEGIDSKEVNLIANELAQLVAEEIG